MRTNEMGKLSRRDFIKRCAWGIPAIGTGSAMGAGLSSCAPGKLSGRMAFYTMEMGTDFEPAAETTLVEPIKSDIFSKVAIMTHPQAVDSDGRINPGPVRVMLDRGIREQTGHQNLQEAWLKFLPDLNTDHIISIKLNCLNYLLPSHPEVVQAITDSLIEIGIPANNIIVWDTVEKTNIIKMGMVRSGYRMNKSAEGVRYLATDSDGIGYDVCERVNVKCLSEELALPVTRILSQISDHVINVPVLKQQHFGITGCMKNFYGAIPLGGAIGGVKGAMSPKDVMNTIKKMHSDLGNPQIPSLYNNPVIRDKVRLNILDAMIGAYSGGPYGPPQWINKQLLISDDPVAADYHQMQIIENKRKEMGLSSILRKAKYIQTAAEMGLGTNNPDQIELMDIALG